MKAGVPSPRAPHLPLLSSHQSPRQAGNRTARRKPGSGEPLGGGRRRVLPPTVSFLVASRPGREDLEQDSCLPARAGSQIPQLQVRGLGTGALG